MPEKLSLDKMARGAFMEHFERELASTLANIADPNCDAKKSRKVTLTMEIKPAEDRATATISVQSKATLVAPKALTTLIMIERDKDGSVVAAELVSGQKGQTYFDKDGSVRDDVGNLVPFSQAAQK